MRQAFKLAFRNLVGSGLRTWLNSAVLAFSLIVILFFNGLMDGWNNQSRLDGISWEYGYGQLWHKDFDLNDSFTYMDGYGHLEGAENESLTPILVRSITLYPQGRMISAVLKGIPEGQSLLSLPTAELSSNSDSGVIPIILGKRMAQSLNLKVGDEVMMRWRDRNGTYDAVSVSVAAVFATNVPMADAGQIWMDLSMMQRLSALDAEVSYYVADKDFEFSNAVSSEWIYKSQEELLKPLTDIVNSKKASSTIVFILFFAIGLLAIFDTQVLSIFRRQREIGTYISLGMTRGQVLRIFTCEGFMYSLFAVVLAAVFGTPLLWYIAKSGFSLPSNIDDMGMIIPAVIYPEYSLGLILGSSFVLVFFATLVSFIPARKIAKMNPLQALKGKAL